MKDEDFIEEKRKIMMNQIEEVIENEVESEGDNGSKAE